LKARQQTIAVREGALQRQWRKAAASVGKRSTGSGETVYPWESVYQSQGEFVGQTLSMAKESVAQATSTSSRGS
jgi:hypothetical protein